MQVHFRNRVITVEHPLSPCVIEDTTDYIPDMLDGLVGVSMFRGGMNKSPHVLGTDLADPDVIKVRPPREGS
jgi:hypothetical protein